MIAGIFIDVRGIRSQPIGYAGSPNNGVNKPNFTIINGTAYFFHLLQRLPLKRYTNCLQKFHYVNGDKLLKLVIFY